MSRAGRVGDAAVVGPGGPGVPGGPGGPGRRAGAMLLAAAARAGDRGVAAQGYCHSRSAW